MGGLGPDGHGLGPFAHPTERLNGSRILGEARETYSLVQAGDSFVFDAEFSGEFALNPAKQDLSVIYWVK